MGIQERKEREKEALRRRIIEAATGLFREETYANVSMRKIAARIEYSVGTLYLYYRDKDELFLAVQEAAFERAFDFIQRLPNAEDPLERLRGLGERYIQFGLENPDLYRLMFMMEHPMQALEESDGWRAGIKLHSLLSSLVEECMQKGRLPQKDPLKMSFMLWSMVHGMVSLKITCRLDIYNGTHLPGCENLNLDVDDMIQGTNNMVMALLNDLAE
ncbi:TetR/AcrR family transcriptional regulator [Lewinella sp. W8]|uniref:TetR/AcrR family transcriptional regulator n=1 Tax=Lewinella sp. W8 TaxID=2528208 RepID=UPI00106897F6|nr:TetR/AcrR family transcriptional regulator [Lewinella sp. W8]MTB51620.1 TetR family transcriptional regulator [Lewinella sp. W8]